MTDVLLSSDDYLMRYPQFCSLGRFPLRAVPWAYIVPAKKVKKTDLVEFSCRCTRKHSDVIRINGKWTRVLRQIHLETGICGRVERRTRPKRGPTPWICDACLEAYDKDYYDTKRNWVDPPPAARMEATYNEEISNGFHDGAYLLGKRLTEQPHAD
jgi:hypothetical protein